MIQGPETVIASKLYVSKFTRIIVFYRMDLSMTTPAQAHFDEPWKEVLDAYFESFLTFFFPAVHPLIDWSQPQESLNTEFLQLMPAATIGIRTVDQLVKVIQLDGQSTILYIHIEVQSQVDTLLPQRMFIYHYRIYDRYSCPVISLVVLGDDSPNWRPHQFSYELGGSRMLLEFPTVKLLDYEWEALEANHNPISVMVMAHLKTKRTTQDPQARKQWKWLVVRQLYERGYDREDIIRLFRLIDWMMTLPDELKQAFNREVQAYEEEKQMPIISSIEIMAREEGKEAGIQLGEQDLIVRQLRRKVGPIPAEVETQIRSLPIKLLEILGEDLLDFGSLTDLTHWLARHSSED